MRRLVLVLAACSSGSSTPEPAPAPVTAPPPPLAPVTGAHGGAIALLAVTADGRAAVTADATGGMRLWPTLDGTREPIVVAAPMATALAIAHDGGGFVIAVTDAADHVVLVAVDSKGYVRSRRQLGAALQVEIAGDSVLALRADQVIDQIAFDGTLRAQLPADSGTRIESLLASGTHVVAIVQGETARHARRIATTPLAWGEPSASLALGDGPAVLAPDGQGVFAINKSHRISRFDLETGKDKPACPRSAITERERHLEGFHGLLVATDAPLGVVGDEVACVVDGTFSWFHMARGGHTTANLVGTLSPATMVVANGRLIVAHEHQLAIATPEKIDYLGYGFRDLTHVRSVPTGVMIGKGDQEPVLLDERFRERVRFALPKLRVDWTDLVPVDDRFIITSSTRPGSGDVWGNAYQIAIYDSVKQVMHQVLPHKARSNELVFEPATNLLVTSDGNTTMLAHLDPATHSLGDEVRLALDAPPKQVALLDPDLSGGMIALAIREEGGGGGLVVSELHAADVPSLDETGKPRVMKPRATYRISGELRAVDRAGRLYVHDVMHPEDVGVYVNGKHVTQLVGAQTAKLRPSPDGQHVVAIDNGRLALFTTAGKRVWDTAAWGSSEVDWTRGGMLYARFPHALVQIDVESGALRDRQCGWAFGISATPRGGSTNAPSVCDVAP